MNLRSPPDPLDDETGPLVLISNIQRHIRVLCLNRPQKRNALSQALIKVLLHGLSTADQDEDVRVIVITGSGSSFSAGADIKEISELDANQARRVRYLEDFSHGVSRIRKPVIAAIESNALGGGFELALMCDIIIASESAVFGFPEVNLGLIPGAGGTQRLAQLTGKYKAMRILLSGEPMSASQAKEYGILSGISERGKALSDALNLAEMIANKSPSAIMLAKEAVQRVDGMGLDLEYERTLYYGAFGTPDKDEGVSAFLEKRSPVWKSCRHNNHV